MKRRGEFLCWAHLLALAALLIAMALPGAVGYAQEGGPLIERVEPAEGGCGSQMELTVFGANFEPGSAVFIPAGVETRFTEFVNPERLMVGIFIAEDAPPGPRPLTVVVPERGEATLEAAFSVVCRGGELPPPTPEPSGVGGGDESPWPMLILGLTVIIGGSLTLAGFTFIIRRTIRIPQRKDWQEQAKEEKPPQTCQPGTLPYCEKIKIKELDLDRRKITHLTVVANDPVSGRKRQERQVKGEPVDALNEAVRARRRGQKPEELQRLVAPIADELLRTTGEWLQREATPCDVFISGHLAGSKVTFQFILYRCRRRGNVNIWEKDDGWQATVADERDVPVAGLRDVNFAEPGLPARLAPPLTQGLLQLIEQV